MSHTSGLIDVSRKIMQKEKVSVDQIRLVDHDVATGVYPDMTEYDWEKDEWPELFDRMFDADILIIRSPIWLGEKSSIAQKLIERLFEIKGRTNGKANYFFNGKVVHVKRSSFHYQSLPQISQINAETSSPLAR